MPVEALTPRFLEKIWGSQHLSPWFADASSKIGEVWLEGPKGESLPLLIKFLFTTEALSVQVHPKDEYARTHHDSNGKTEMWHILRASPGSRIALGLKQALTPEELRESSQTGEIENHLNWIDVSPGETYFVPAGTIHAIGAGIALCEIQQQSDVTYRLYDYHRPRELHLEHAMKVSDLRAYERPRKPVGFLAECAYFRTQRLVVRRPVTVPGDGPQWLICLEGQGTIGELNYGPGKAFEVTGDQSVRIHSAGSSVFLRTWVP